MSGCVVDGCKRKANWESSHCVDNYCKRHLTQALGGERPEDHGWKEEKS